MSRIPASPARRTAFLCVLAVLAGLTCRDTLTSPTEIPRPPSLGGPAFTAFPTGITESVVAQSISHPTTMAMAPDGRIFIAEQGGRLRVFKNNALLSTPFVTLSVNASGERGLLGIAFDPDFASNRYVYLYYTTSAAPIHNRVSRFTANGDVAAAGSELVILNLDNLSSATNHNGGALHFGPDGKLYIAVGDNANSANAQSMTSMFGKILRINPDGTIPADNPFFASATGNYRAIWALGFRNPFTFNFQPGTGRMFINDVGENTWEEIDDGIAGANYGWPSCEGNCAQPNPNFRNPVTAYAHTAGECAVTGAAFYNPPSGQLLPSSYVGKYFFADYCANWIRVLDPATGSATGFATAVGKAPVDLQVGIDGALYYLSNYDGQLRRISGTATQAPLISLQPNSVTVSFGQSATFTTSATGNPILTYQWRRGGTAIPGATSPTYTVPTTGSNDNGAAFDCVVTNGYGSATTNAATLTVTSNQPPDVTIQSPITGTTYHGGQTFNYSATATDPETGALPDSAFTWEVVFHHDSHTHPFVLPTTGSKTGSFAIPTEGEVSSNVYFAILLTVKDPSGATTTVERDITPETATISIASAPPGAQITLDGQPHTTPASVVGVVGVQRTLGVVANQTLSGMPHTFTSWSDGGAATHTIATPSSNTTFTATFDQAACTYALSSASRTVVAAGGAYGVDVTSSAPACTWSATSTVSWLTITAGETGQGNATASYSVAPSTAAQRVGTMTIAGKTFTVTQNNGCLYVINPATQTVPVAGGSGTVDVTTDATCAWSATSNNGWITVTPGAESGTGSGAVGFSVTENAGLQRSGSITVGGQTLALTQSGITCSYAINPTSHTHASGAGGGAVGVTAAAVCPWTAVSNTGWITVAAGSESGTGTGTANYTVTANAGLQRTGSITVAGQTYAVTQDNGCAYTINPLSRDHAAASGSGSVGVTSGSGCPWSASSNSAWITVSPGSETGAGDGAASYAVAANTGPSRSGSLTVAGQAFSVTQSSGCTYAITPATQTVPVAGGSGTVDVTTDATCAWSAASNNGWITVTPGAESGTGSGAVGFSVTENAGLQRSGSITVGGQTLALTQSGITCSYAINPTSHTHAAGAGGGSVGVTAAAVCPWTAVSNTGWITVAAGSESGTGTGTANYTVTANAGLPRTGSITVAGQTYAVTQDNGCAYVINPLSRDHAAGSGSGSVGVTSGSGCPWSASSNSAWITVSPGSETGAGEGAASYAVAANTGPSRSGSMTVAGQAFSVTQSSGCTYAITPATQTVPVAGGSGTVDVTTDATCAWSATSNNGWITVTPGAESGTGSGAVGFSVTENAGLQRSGSITVGGQTLALTQSGITCSYGINPTSQTHAAGAGGGSVGVTAAAVCPWTAVSNTGWITVAAWSESGTGTGTANYTVTANAGLQRTGSITVAGQTYAVTQDNGCAYVINPLSRDHAAGSGSGSVGVTSGSGCPWSASSNSAWITVSPGSETGAGEGAASYAVAANTGPSRNGSMTVAGQAFSVTQSSGCTYTINPTTLTMAATSGTGTVDVTTDPACAWNATSNTGWITVTAGSESGTGTGTANYTVTANSGLQRTGSITVAGQTYSVTQDNGCAYAINPLSRDHAAGSGSGSVGVTSGSGCPWSASSNSAWITVSPGSETGAGDGAASYVVAANTGLSRSGSMTVAGQTFSVTQANGCTYAITPASLNYAVAGGSGSVGVASGSGCPWSASSNSAWITVSPGSETGAGAGAASYSVAANTGPSRSGSMTVAGKTFSVTQSSGCTYTINPTSRTHTAGSGTAGIGVTTQTGCAWTSVSNNSWITLTQFSDQGVGNGTSDYVVAANTGPQRTGSITIAGQTYTVTQNALVCTYTLSPTSRTHTPASGGGSISMAAGTGCPWTATSNNSWITVTSGSSGTGGGTTNYSVTANTGAQRTGTLSVGGQTFTVTQTGCSYTINPTSRNHSPSGGTGTVSVTAGTGCVWTAKSNNSWITVTGGASGSGNGTVSYSVSARPWFFSRTGTITIAGKTFTVRQ